MNIFYDIEVDDFVRENTSKLMNSAKIKINKSDINIIYFGDNNINASIANPKFITLNSGVFTKLDSPFELFAILAHEVGHVKNNHISRKFSSMEYSEKKNNKILYSAILTAGIINPIIPLTAMLVKSQGDKFLELKYSREYEIEADLESLKILQINGYNPINLYNVMSKMNKESNKTHNEEFQQNIQYIISHPITSERLKYLAIKSKKYKSLGDNDLLTNNSIEILDKFYRIKAKIMGYINKDPFFLTKDEINYQVQDRYDFYNQYFLIHKQLANDYITKKDLNIMLSNVNAMLNESKFDKYLIEIKFLILEKINRDSALKYIIKNIDKFKDESYFLISHQILNLINKNIITGNMEYKNYGDKLALNFCQTSKMLGKNAFCYKFFKHSRHLVYSKYYEAMNFVENQNFLKSKDILNKLIESYKKESDVFEKKNMFFNANDLKCIIENIDNIKKST